MTKKERTILVVWDHRKREIPESQFWRLRQQGIHVIAVDILEDGFWHSKRPWLPVEPKDKQRA